jgi:hypothetical protein
MRLSGFERLTHDLQSSLELVQQLIAEARASESASSSAQVRRLAEALAARPSLDVLPTLLLETYREVTGALGRVRQTREAIVLRTLERVRRTHDGLADVALTTESAATAILDGLERGLDTLGRLEAVLEQADPAQRAAARELSGQVRDELNQVVSYVQFQDITAQQLAGVSGLLEDVERRLGTVVRLFTPAPDLVSEERVPPNAPYDAAATLSHSASRQALADAIFAEVHATRGVAGTGE